MRRAASASELASVSPGARSRALGRAFSLLEVMVAVAILGLLLSVILSAQGGLAASNRSAANMGMAADLARCKMTEIEEKMLRDGYPEIDALDTEVPCCLDGDREGYLCDTRVEKVRLPQPPQNSLDDGGSLLASAGGGDGGVLGALSNPAGTGELNLDGGVQNLQSQLGPGGAQGMLTMVMGLVYPGLKPMMEASIRRVTVLVKWKEGPKAKQLELTQFITNPQRGGIGFGVDAGAPPATSGTAASPTSPAATTPARPASPIVGGAASPFSIPGLQ